MMIPARVVRCLHVGRLAPRAAHWPRLELWTNPTPAKGSDTAGSGRSAAGPSSLPRSMTGETMIATARKTLYRNELRALTEAGPVRLKLLATPQESRYADKPPFARVLLERNDQEHTFVVESEAVRAALARKRVAR